MILFTLSCFSWSWFHFPVFMILISLNFWGIFLYISLSCYFIILNLWCWFVGVFFYISLPCLFHHPPLLSCFHDTDFIKSLGYLSISLSCFVSWSCSRHSLWTLFCSSDPVTEAGSYFGSCYWCWFVLSDPVLRCWFAVSLVVLLPTGSAYSRGGRV